MKNCENEQAEPVKPGSYNRPKRTLEIQDLLRELRQVGAVKKIDLSITTMPCANLEAPLEISIKYESKAPVDRQGILFDLLDQAITVPNYLITYAAVDPTDRIFGS